MRPPRPSGSPPTRRSSRRGGRSPPRTGTRAWMHRPARTPPRPLRRRRDQTVGPMIERGSGDLLEAHVDALVNTVNTAGLMGKGLALQFKKTFPASYEAYRKECKAGRMQIGKVLVVPMS